MGKARKGKGPTSRVPKNPCKLPGHSVHDWKDCFNNPIKSDKFRGTALTLKDFDKDGNRIKKQYKKEEDRCNEQSDEEVRYDSETSGEEFNLPPDQEFKKEKQVMSAELIIAVPEGVGSKNFKVYRALADTGTSS